MLRAPKPYKPYRLFRSATVGAIVAITLFEVMLKVFHLEQELAAVLLGLAMVPALVTGLMRQVAALVAHPDTRLPTIGYAFGNIGLTICFFAYLYQELGIYSPADPLQEEVDSFLTCLYFSASTFTTAGLGDFVPTPEARFMAALEMIFGYIALGIVTAASFFLLVHRSRGRSPQPPADLEGGG
ncbi:MAG TPA: potassium channel family protein [Longimicrobium sp.]|nr:potassium channel family protein [Longimicrobium sp.]